MDINIWVRNRRSWRDGERGFAFGAGSGRMRAMRQRQPLHRVIAPRSRPRGRYVALVACVAAAACGEAPEAVAPAPAPPPVPAPAAGWALQASAAGTAIAWTDAAGAEVMRIACRPGGEALYAAVPQVARIGSEERLTVGAGEVLATLVVPPDIPAGAPVSGAGELPDGFVAALEDGGALAASYGAHPVGPLPPPEGEVRRAFVDGCRRAAG